MVLVHDMSSKINLIEAQRRGQAMAQAILKETNAARKWGKLLESKDEAIQLQALKFLHEQAYGKAPQPNTHGNENGQPFRLVFESSVAKD